MLPTLQPMAKQAKSKSDSIIKLRVPAVSKCRYSCCAHAQGLTLSEFARCAMESHTTALESKVLPSGNSIADCPYDASEGNSGALEALSEKVDVLIDGTQDIAAALNVVAKNLAGVTGVFSEEELDVIISELSKIGRNSQAMLAVVFEEALVGADEED